MSFRNLFVSLAVVASLTACGVEEGFEDLVDMFEGDSKPSSSSKKPSSSSSSDRRGGDQVPAFDASDFVGTWNINGLQYQSTYGSSEQSEKPFVGRTSITKRGDAEIVYYLGDCMLPALIEGKTATFDVGKKCYSQSSDGVELALTLDEGYVEWQHAGHLYLGIRLLWEPTDRSLKVGGIVTVVAELTADGHRSD